jgi:hypothetical protein
VFGAFVCIEWTVLRVFGRLLFCSVQLLEGITILTLWWVYCFWGSSRSLRLGCHVHFVLSASYV